MRTSKLLIATATAVAALCALVGTATANRLRNSATSARATFGAAEFSGGFGTTRCSLTLEGTLHSATVTKTNGLLVGYVTRASIGPCPSGSATINTASIPWHTTYESFTGTLPNITTVRLHVVGAEWSVRETFGITCTVSRTAAEPVTGTVNREAGGTLTSLSMGGSINTSCGIRGTLSGTSSSLSVVGSSTRITVTLI
jgi:hypothetical protein